MAKTILILCFALLFSCIERFDPALRSNVDTPLVVEGLVTTETGPYTVRLSRARLTNASNNQNLISDASVSIDDDLGNSYNLTATNPGVYQTDPADFTGEIGRSYRVRIDIAGDIYISDFDKVLKSYPISGIRGSFSFKDVQSETGNVTTEPVVTIYANLNFPTEKYYYRYDWEATYEARTPLQGSEVCWADALDAPSSLGPLKRCYITEKSSNFLRLLTNERLSGTTFTNFEVFKIDPNKRFQLRFSPLIKQYSLSESAYQYWKNVELLSSGGGSLFDVPPAPIQGNIYSLSSTQKVLGYFGASDVSTMRSFFSSGIIEAELEHYEQDCQLESGLGAIGTQVFPPTSCCECTFLPNSTDSKPEYWID